MTWAEIEIKETMKANGVSSIFNFSFEIINDDEETIESYNFLIKSNGQSARISGTRPLKIFKETCQHYNIRGIVADAESRELSGRLHGLVNHNRGTFAEPAFLPDGAEWLD